MVYYIRLDDACERRDIDNWNRMEKILDAHNISPFVGIIPHCEDPKMNQYAYDNNFWNRVQIWKEKGWILSLHGYNHVCITKEGGLNPVQMRSEFAGVPLQTQEEKITKGVAVFRKNGIDPKVFFAPSHTFDQNTILALKKCSSIRIINDTISNKPYSMDGITFIPQQSGHVRVLPLHTVTFCYHPNTMVESDFDILEQFLSKHKNRFLPFHMTEADRENSILDKSLNKLYFLMKRIKPYAK